MDEENEVQVEEAPSLRDTLEDAIHEAEEPAVEAGEDAEKPVPAAAEGEGPARDESGRFKSKESVEAVHAEAQPGADARQPAAASDRPVAEGAGNQDALSRPPQSWNPAAREHWSKIPPEVRAEVYRREQDVQQAFHQTAEERKLASAFKQVYAPYEAMIRGEGSDPLRAVDHLFQTAYQLRTAAPQQKAQLVAGLIQQYAIDIPMLDAMLSGQAPQMPQQGAPQQPQVPHDPRVDNLMQALQNIQHETATKKQAAAQQEVQAFAQSHEFLDDVRDVMADLIEVASNRGMDLSMEDAYNQACRLNPEISRVLEQREKVRTAQESQQRTSRSRRAASSVAGSPAGAPPSDGRTLSRRDAILQAMEDSAG